MIRTSTLPSGVATIIHTTDWRTIVLRLIQPLTNSGQIDSVERLGAVVVIDCGSTFVKLPEGGSEVLARHFFPRVEGPTTVPIVVPAVVASALAGCARPLTEPEAKTLSNARVPILFLCGDDLIVFGLDALLGEREAQP